MDVFTPPAPRGTSVGRYALYDKLAASARAEVWLGRARGQPDSPLLAIKRLHRELLCDPVFVSAVITEARRGSTVEHPNLVRLRDVALIEGRELLLVSEYLAGETLAQLFGACFRSRTRMPLPVAMGIVAGVLRGLEAAHEARDGSGASLGIVHGGLSPQNVLVGADGIARVLDFGPALARARAPASTALYAQGKRAYLSPEQVRREPVDRRTDVYAAAVILWELLAGERLFRETDGANIALQITSHRIPRLIELHPDLPGRLDEVLAPALARTSAARPATAGALARALEALVPPASATEIASWMAGVARDRLAERAELVAAVVGAPDPPEPSHADAGLAAPDEPDTAPLPWAVSTLTTAHPSPRRKGLLRLVWLAGAIAIALLLASARGARRPPAAPERTAIATPLPRPLAAMAAARAPVVAVERVNPPRLEAAPTAPRTRAHEPRRQPARAHATPAAAHCQPPFTVDAEGIRRVKRECLH